MRESWLTDMGKSFAKFCIIAFVCALVLFYVCSIIDGPTKAHASTPANPAIYGEAVQVKLFSMAVTQHENLDKLETDINTWLKQNADKIEVLTPPTQSSAGQYRIDIAIWYRVKK